VVQDWQLFSFSWIGFRLRYKGLGLGLRLRTLSEMATFGWIGFRGLGNRV
jgi:hypothetical protein